MAFSCILLYREIDLKSRVLYTKSARQLERYVTCKVVQAATSGGSIRGDDLTDSGPRPRLTQTRLLFTRVDVRT